MTTTGQPSLDETRPSKSSDSSTASPSLGEVISAGRSLSFLSPSAATSPCRKRAQTAVPRTHAASMRDVTGNLPSSRRIRSSKLDLERPAELQRGLVGRKVLQILIVLLPFSNQIFSLPLGRHN